MFHNDLCVAPTLYKGSVHVTSGNDLRLKKSDVKYDLRKIFIAALWNRAGHYIFALWFLLLSSIFFRRLISDVADWMSTILLHMVWP